jgi:drug/metabolite transporter (DMT)-like permease
LSREHSPFAVNFTRALIALPLFVLAIFMVAGGVSAGLADLSALRWSHVGWFTLSMIASYALGDTLFLWSTRSLGVPGALAIASSYPLITAAYEIVYGGVPLGFSQLAGLLLTVGGVIAVILCAPRQKIQISGGAKRRFMTRRSGVILGFGASAMWALNSFAVARGGVDVTAPVGNSVRMALALILSFAFGKVFSAGAPSVLPARVVRRYLWVFGIEAFGGSYFFLYGLSHSSLVVGSTLASLAPVIAVPVAWAVGLEKISPLRTAAVFAVVLGLWLLVGGMAP